MHYLNKYVQYAVCILYALCIEIYSAIFTRRGYGICLLCMFSENVNTSTLLCMLGFVEIYTSAYSHVCLKISAESRRFLCDQKMCIRNIGQNGRSGKNSS